MVGNEIRVRFAPSPTGYLHLGGARVAIFNWLFARSQKGKFLLRIEDTDVERSKKEYFDAIVESLSWLKIFSDEPVVVQSSRVERHRDVVAILLSEGLAYKCYCSVETLSEQRNESGMLAFKYPNTCRDLKNFSKADRPYVVRIKMEQLEEKLTFHDLIKGEISVDSGILDDFVILKSNGMPTYNFAVVIDDIDMKVSHVIRGEDHIINTFKQMELYKLLRQKIPFFGHLPMIMASNGERLSKRFGAVSVGEFCDQGFLADAMFNYLVRLGWSHGDQEIFSREELQKIFSLENVGVKNAVFDTEKLMWLNGHYLRQLCFDEFLENIPKTANDLQEYLKQPFRKKILAPLFDLYKVRYSRVTELAEVLMKIDLHWESFDKNKIYAAYPFATINIVRRFLEIVIQQKIFVAAEMQKIAKVFLDQEKIPLIHLAKPLRFVLVGDVEGPAVFSLLEIFGPEYIRTLFDNL